mmetsp:Transcript_14830/g.30578  ORF Transcript_14830/g.30578 Transcript_14830/m.30578 type:complete len:88 (-) Transcript_14830:304-567(-)
MEFFFHSLRVTWLNVVSYRESQLSARVGRDDWCPVMHPTCLVPLLIHVQQHEILTHIIQKQRTTKNKKPHAHFSGVSDSSRERFLKA